ncbi:cupin domain-containing protein [Oscillospiraceae bacterium PP1C4]
MNVSEELIREIVEKVLRESQGSKDSFEKQVDKSGVLVVRTDTVKTETFGGNDRVSLKDIVSLEEAPRMGAGIMEVDHTSFEWTLTYDEYDFIIDGTLEIEVNGAVITGHKGDIIYIPKNSHIHFRSPDHARFAYFVYPADWQSQS